MSSLNRIFLSLPKLILTAAAIGMGSGQSEVMAQGHGGGAGHVGGGGGGGYGGYGGRGYGFGRYGYGGYGYGGYGFGLGLGLGLGLGFGLGYYGDYPYYGYPYAYGYPNYPYPYGYPGYTGVPPVVGSPPGPVPPTIAASSASGGGVVVPAGRSPDSDVTIIVRTPTDAVVWINGVKTTQTGPRRDFVSSGLVQGRNYTFDIRAQWVGVDGKPVDLHRRVPAQAGERRLIDFTLPPPSSGEVTVVEYGVDSQK